MTAAASTPAAPVVSAALRIRGLRVTAGPLELISGVDLDLAPGERVGLIGESGSGKTLTALALLGLLPEGVHSQGEVRLHGGANLIDLPERAWAQVRGPGLAMVFQEPMSALNPTMRVGRQVEEALLLHDSGTRRVGDGGRAAAQSRTLELLSDVRLPDPAEIARAYPHQLSGGQRQRVMLAIALANDPQVLLCDEPTTGLDVTVQAQLLDLIVSGAAQRGSSLLFITHDLAVLATVCSRVLVMYGGRVVETGPVSAVLRTPHHRYTAGLLDSSDLDRFRDRARLPTIPGSVPAAGEFPDGCVFRTRCAAATEACHTEPPWTGTQQHGYACWHPLDPAGSGDEGSTP